MESQLSNAHQKTYDHLFQHPMPHNLQWREVWSMLNAMPDVQAVALAACANLAATLAVLEPGSGAG